MDEATKNWFASVSKNKAEKNNQIPKSNILRESLIDFERHERCPDIFSSDDKLHSKVKDFITGTYDKIFKEIGIDKDKVKSIYIIGSSVGFYWNDYTDIDVPALIDDTPEKVEEYSKKLIEKYGTIYSEMKGFTHPFNLYLLPYDKKQPFQITIDGIYQVFPKEEFVQKKQPKIDMDFSVLEIVLPWCRKADLDLGELRRSVADYMFYKEGLENIGKIEEKKERIENMEKIKWREIIYDLQAIRDGAKSLKIWRTDNHKRIWEEFKGVLPDKITIDYKNMSMFDGILVKKMMERYKYAEDIEHIKFILARYKSEKIKKEDVINECIEIFKKRDDDKKGEK